MTRVHTLGPNQIRPFDREVLNRHRHLEFTSETSQDDFQIQELLAFGLAKGAVVILHMKRLD